eukprot:gnl/TRDRNA2_/TRDRNA2_113454_c1_seq1.p1 gnl/TRDRNA2_/TRDRNA2_113454_c1~~gnl/TRDRNA2_/TRDRNA2_113454_c1_seq1.p1  ORF type:complete len:430 (+),score=53.89 gnl/TRDRNA2_/TRDRNA2_113454_c1_seq1:73-1290(+)
MSTAIDTQYQRPRQPEGTCREVRCEQDQMRIRVGSYWIICRATEPGKRIAMTGNFWGDVICPSYADLCGSPDNQGPVGIPCMFPGVLRHGRCTCGPGYLNEDCIVRDTAANRPDYPFGLRYRQQELVLEMEMPPGQTPGVEAWPLSPALANSKPWDFTPQYSVYPQLPKGLFISKSGIVEGTPMEGHLRAAFTVRATGGKGASTTTLWITVLCRLGDSDCNREHPITTTAPPVPWGDGQAAEDKVASETSDPEYALNNLLAAMSRDDVRIILSVVAAILLACSSYVLCGSCCRKLCCRRSEPPMLPHGAGSTSQACVRGIPLQTQQGPVSRGPPPQLGMGGVSTPVATVVGQPLPAAARPATDRNAAMSRLLDMGYDFASAQRALEQSGWDVNRAVTRLCATAPA